jgi:uncharacterized membrane protein
MIRALRTFFITGLLVFIPFIVTVYVLWEVFLFLDNLIGQYIVMAVGREIPGLGLLGLVAIIFFVGILTTNFLGRELIDISEAVVRRIPLARTIYNTTKEIINPFFVPQNRIFSRCVLVEYPRKGVYSLGFVTSESKGEVQVKTEEKVINVFLATTPNPTSGVLLFVPEADTVPLDMSIEDGMKLIISGGFVVPKYEVCAVDGELKEGETDVDT